ncbi:MAG: serpin family protein [Waterburya sp.]
MKRNTILRILGVSLLLGLITIIFQEKTSFGKQIQPNSLLPKLLAAETTTITKMSQLVAANNRFGFNLFRQLHSTQSSTQNLVISPKSIAIALAMTRNGTSSSTLEEMTNVLKFKQLEAQTIDASYAKLLTTLKTADSDIQLAIANSLWVNQNITLKEQFVNNSQKFYQAEITNLDFANPAAKNVINKWVEQKTVNKIPQIVDSISPEDALYLINAIYFKGNWTKQFDPNLTTQQPFYLQPNAPKPQAMMNQTGDYRYYANDQFQAIRIPYGKNAELGMYIFLPKETSNLQQFNQQLNIDNWQEWLSQMRSRQGTITLPRFKLEYETQLNDVLISLGMKKIFTPSQADFSQMTDTSVVLNSVKHKTVIEVNEEGTEATGVTSIGIRITSATPEEPNPFTMNVNRPFFFAIRDDITETILFMGNVIEPK